MPGPTAGGENTQQWMQELQQATERMVARMNELTTTWTVTVPNVPNVTASLNFVQSPPAVGAYDRARELARAERTAHELLMSCLTRKQQLDMVEKRYIEVFSNAGHRWRIFTGGGYQGNVHLMEGDRGDTYLAGFCAHGRDRMTRCEHYLVQKLVLEADEAQFIRVAITQYANPGVRKVFRELWW